MQAPFPSDPHLDARLPADLLALIQAEVYGDLKPYTHTEQYHRELQARLQALGERLGYISQAEYLTFVVCDEKYGRVDVVWTPPNGGRGIAFELDSSWRRRSAAKLRQMAPTHHPVWIVFGDPYMARPRDVYDLDSLILIQPDPARLPTFCRGRRGREQLAAYRKAQRTAKAERRTQAAADRAAAQAAAQSSEARPADGARA